MSIYRMAGCILFFLAACNNSSNKKPGTVVDKPSAPIGCYSPKTTDADWYSSGKKAPLFNGLTGIDFPITTKNPQAQTYFNQGLLLAYGFNHAEAARSFYEATRLDSTCAMAYWGYAYVLGPNYNGGMEEGNFERAYTAATRAKQLATHCSPKEQALIGALETRYAAQPPEDRKPLDIAYAAAMKKVHKRFSADPDIGALYAEAMMDLHPWDLYEKATKKPRPWTTELCTVLEGLMKANPKHPGAHHFYIHALEASATPEKALASAALLDTLVAGAGHLLHMPSHIYINTGDYHLGTLANLRAVAADSGYTTACHAQGVYPLAYYPHNYHFLAATATLEGNGALAWQAAQKLQEHTAKDIMRQPGWGTLQHYYTIPYYIAVKFGMWDRIQQMAPPPADLVYPRAIWHYANAMALLGKHDLPAAKKEAAALQQLSTDTSLLHLTVWDINTTADLAQIAALVTQAQVALAENKTDSSIVWLQQAVTMEDRLNYNEPPDWFFSVRHLLGAALLKAGSYSQAEKVYMEDLRTWKKNGWALIGLYNALLAQQKTQKAEEAKAAFATAWKYADTDIRSSSGLIE